MKFTIIVDPSFVIITIQSLSLYGPIKVPPFGVGDREIYNFLPPYPKDATYEVQSRLRRRCQLQRTTHDGRQPIAIGHLSDSGDLTKVGKQLEITI